MRGGWGVRGCRASGADREADEHEFGPWHAAWSCPGGPRSAPTPLGLDSAPMKGAIALVGSGEFTPALEAIDRELLAATGRARPRGAVLPPARATGLRAGAPGRGRAPLRRAARDADAPPHPRRAARLGGARHRRGDGGGGSGRHLAGAGSRPRAGLARSAPDPTPRRGDVPSLGLRPSDARAALAVDMASGPRPNGGCSTNTKQDALGADAGQRTVPRDSGRGSSVRFFARAAEDRGPHGRLSMATGSRAARRLVVFPGWCSWRNARPRRPRDAGLARWDAGSGPGNRRRRPCPGPASERARAPTARRGRRG